MKRVLFVSRKHNVVDISNLVKLDDNTEVMHGAVCTYRKASFLINN